MTTPHENFKSHMKFHIGMKFNSYSSYLTRYPTRVGKEKDLSNGNKEIEFTQGNDCQVWFEVDKNTSVIIDWYFVGNEKTCRITP
ncbi:hypothetical protein [Colwellia sp. 12G3]|uniref:hypothetical protein n=1 Tax=Colwellia sp. 12G3 TaxID=2058299 RepID=UPI0012FEAC60|nr:hypothetical protein [Colwellia sp. 12G3]